MGGAQFSPRSRKLQAVQSTTKAQRPGNKAIGGAGLENARDMGEAGLSLSSQTISHSPEK